MNIVKIIIKGSEQMVSSIQGVNSALAAQQQAQNDSQSDELKMLMKLMKKLKEAEAKGDSTQVDQLQAQLTSIGMLSSNQKC